MRGVDAKAKSQRALIQSLRKYGPSGEAVDHKAIKEWVAHHLEAIGLIDVKSVYIERPLLSGDLADIVVKHNDGSWSLVEVETSDPLIGAYQAIKLKALMNAEEGVPLNADKVSVYLVTWPIAGKVRELCIRYAINMYEPSVHDGKISMNKVPN